MSFVPKGVLPAMVTPFDKEGKINEKALIKLINHLLDGGVHGIFAVGTTGEFYGLSHEEYRRLLQITVDQVKGRVPVYAGATSIVTKDTVGLVNIAEECKVDAVSVLTPMFISPNQDQVYGHYKTIAENTGLPILLYNNSPKTGVSISVKTAEKLADIDNIIGIKDSSGDFTLTSEYIRTTQQKDFHVLAGRDTLIYATLCYGGSGAIAACANIAPRLCADIYDKFIAGDLDGALKAQYKLAPLRIGFTLGTFPTVIKEALELIGIDVGSCLEPVGAMKPEEKEELKKILINMGIL